MSLKTISTTRWRRPSASRPAPARASGRWPQLGAELLRQVREPLAWTLRLGERCDPGALRETLGRAARGTALDDWDPPPWLFAHQVDAARRLAGSLEMFGGALCADAVGLGKTFVALAIATRYRRIAAVVPAILSEQWERRALGHGIRLVLVSHESLSRGAGLPSADLTIVDEAHRFRNPLTRRYQALDHRPPGDRLLLLTATPVVNRGRDLAAQLRLFLPDNGVRIFGVPSLAAALAGRGHEAIAHAAGAVMVARSHRVVTVPLPPACDSPPESPPPVRRDSMDRLLAKLAELRYPTFADRSARALLDLHLRYRLASSRAAALETLRHHLRYLESAAEAARRGARLPRSAMSLLREESEGQLELALAPRVAAALDAGRIEAEQGRIRAAVADLRALPERGPKLDRLMALLAARPGRKTIVFTAAAATARAMAGELGWRETAVVSGKGAWIATGRVSVDEALTLFAPDARGAPRPSAARRVMTLIATDLASEGLDLQDADAVVHYDLPWTPVRLEQRLGRIARLGSPHAGVSVHWFGPPPELDRDLALRRRIADKIATQFALGVPESSGVGRARIQADQTQWRERLAARHGSSGPPRFATVAGPAAAAFALSWRVGPHRCAEIVVFEGLPVEEVRSPARAGAVLARLMEAPASPSVEAPGTWIEVARRLVRTRLAGFERGADDLPTRRVARLLARHAATAARAREAVRLDALDRALARVLAGVRPGALELLRQAVSSRDSPERIEAWLTGQRDFAGPVSVTLLAALIGNGSARALSSGPAG